LRERREFAVLVGLAALWGVGLLISPGEFLQLNRFNRMFRSAARTAVVGYGVALLMVTAEFDLSVGSLLALTGAMSIFLVGDLGLTSPFAILLILAFAFIYGISQGLMVTKLKLPSLIVTIGTLTLLRGALRVLTGGVTISASERNSDLSLYQVFGSEIPVGIDYRIPVLHSETLTFNSFSLQIVWMVLFLILFHYVLFYTRFGHHVRATGDNVQSVGTTGIDPELIKIGAFGIAGVMSAFGAMMLIGRSPSISSSTASGFELLVIAAVVLGGTKLTGGEGSMVGTALGALVLASADTILNLANLGLSGWQSVITGAFIIAAIGLDAVFRVLSVNAIRATYFAPSRQMITSPVEFFRVQSVRKTTDDMFAYAVTSVLVTGISILIADIILGFDAVSSAIGIDTSDLQIFLEGGTIEALVQVYFFVFLLAILGFVVIEIMLKIFGNAGDYEGTLAIVCYSTLPAPLLTIPVMVYGYDLTIVGSTLDTGVLMVVPILLLMLGLIYTGLKGTRDLSSGEALATTGATGVAWGVVLAYILLAVLSIN